MKRLVRAKGPIVAGSLVYADEVEFLKPIEPVDWWVNPPKMIPEERQLAERAQKAALREILDKGNCCCHQHERST